MNRDKAYILDTIDEYRRSASAQDTGEYFEPVFLSFPQKVTIKCPHCGKNQKIDGVTLWPNGGMMGVDDLPADDISIIANCSGCGTRIAMSRNSVKKSMEARGSMMRTLVLLVIILAVALGVGGFTLFKVQSEKYFREGSTALRSQQYEQAVEALTKASDWGSADALYLLSECYRSGNGVAADEAMADELFAKALEKGSGYAVYDQAMKSFDTYIETADQTALNDCIEGLQESDAPDAKYQLSLLTRSGIGVKVDTEQADSLLREAAEACPGRPVYGLVGGLHLFKTPEPEIRRLAERIRKTGVQHIYTGHCTGPRAVELLQEELGGVLHTLRTGLRFSL